MHAVAATPSARASRRAVDSDPDADGTQLGFDDLRFLNRSSWSLTIPSFIYNFVKNNSDAQVLARPQLRISEGEKAALLIGDKVPIPTTTFNTSNTVGGNIVPITSFQYQDVGIKINIEPRVHHNLEVTLKLHVEVSNLGPARCRSATARRSRSSARGRSRPSSA